MLTIMLHWLQATKTTVKWSITTVVCWSKTSRKWKKFEKMSTKSGRFTHIVRVAIIEMVHTLVNRNTWVVVGV